MDPTATSPTIRRSLLSHAPVRAKPRDVLARLHDYVDADTPPHGPDGPVERLERRIAELLGKDASLFFPTGTMAQQVALRLHAMRRGRMGFAAHPQNHLDVWEQKGYNAVHGMWLHPAGYRHQLLTAADLAAIGEPVAAVVWELPQRDLGGLLPEWDELTEQLDVVRATGAATHLDGARIWEAQTYYQRPFDEIASLFDTVYVSLYKALQSGSGAALAADAGTIAEARVWRRRLGGDLPAAWPFALAAMDGLDRLLRRMPEFRDHAIAVATAINTDGVAYAFPDPPQTPMFHVHLPVGRHAVGRAAEELLAETGTQLFGGLRSAPDPRRCSFEVSVGENAMDFTADEVVATLHDLLDRAAGA